MSVYLYIVGTLAAYAMFEPAKGVSSVGRAVHLVMALTWPLSVPASVVVLLVWGRA